MGRAAIAIEVIQLPEDLLPGVLEAAEVVLEIRIVVRREGVEALHAADDLGLLLFRQGGRPADAVDRFLGERVIARQWPASIGRRSA
jgi:hypothetical protein